VTDRIAFFTLGVLFLLIAGCSQAQLLDRFSSPADQATARGYVDKLRARDFDAIESAADQSIKNETFRDTLARMANAFPPGDPTSVKVVGAQTFGTPQYTNVSTTFEFDFQDQWVLASVVVRKQGDAKSIVGFHVHPETMSLERQNAFTLAGKSAIAYAVLVAALIAVLLTLYALVLCARTRFVRGRKWLWILFICVGFGKLTVNWTTGQWGLSLLHVQAFSASAFAPLYSPWMIGVSLPLGAILFLLRRDSLQSPSPLPEAKADAIVR